MRYPVRWLGALARVGIVLTGMGVDALLWYQCVPVLTAGGQWMMGFTLLVAVSTLLSAWRPDSIPPTLVCLAVAWWWCVMPAPHPLGVTLLCVALLGLFHLLCAWAGTIRLESAAAPATVLGLGWRALAYVGAGVGVAAGLGLAALPGAPRSWLWVLLAGLLLAALLVVIPVLTQRDED